MNCVYAVVDDRIARSAIPTIRLWTTVSVTMNLST